MLVEQEIAALDKHAESGPNVRARHAEAGVLAENLKLRVDSKQEAIGGRGFSAAMWRQMSRSSVSARRETKDSVTPVFAAHERGALLRDQSLDVKPPGSATGLAFVPASAEHVDVAVAQVTARHPMPRCVPGHAPAPHGVKISLAVELDPPGLGPPAMA